MKLNNNMCLFIIIILLICYLCMDIIEGMSIGAKECNLNGETCTSSNDCDGGAGYCTKCHDQNVWKCD